MPIRLVRFQSGEAPEPSTIWLEEQQSGAVIGNKIYCIGGEFGHDTLHLQQNFVDVYDAVAQTWTRVASIPQAKSHNESSTFVTPDGKILKKITDSINDGIEQPVFTKYAEYLLHE